ncbi:formation of crista junctions protein 1 [Striga asiatica]|uniref:Formation of crista junctions protein 1 n=1 Tax=Striga asiatica TaxID=4170 RepID=A0A5A7QE96_STRAF|nr:formation of crista junctions protein 1 [Striga asiatica]
MDLSEASPSPPSSPASTPAAIPSAADIAEPAVDPVSVQGDRRGPINFPNAHGIQFHSWAQVNSYERLTERRIVPTIYVDEFLLKTLGLHDDVMQMLDVMGWRKVMTGNWPVFVDLTLEFLSTFRKKTEDVLEFQLGTECSSGATLSLQMH